MTTACRSRIIPALMLVLGFVLFSVNPSVADPPSPAQGDAEKTPRKKTPRQQQFKSLEEAIAGAEVELQADYRFPIAALVYSFSTPDDRSVQARTELHFVGTGRSGYLPGRAQTSGAALVPVHVPGVSQPVALHIIAPGFERYMQRTILHPGEIIIWGNIVLKPTTEKTAAAVVGRVRLEDEDKELEGLVIYVDQEAVAFTNAEGYFVVDTVREGKLRISSHKTGYEGLYTQLTVESGYEHTCELVGYRKRFARVRWLYQPDGTRNFDVGVRTGAAVLSSTKLSRVSFVKGFKQVSGYSDFLVSQKEDRLVFRHFDVRGLKIPGSMRIKDSGFDELYEAPKSGYKRSEFTLRPGDLYVFQCYDGKHYAMMEVVDITVEPPSPE